MSKHETFILTPLTTVLEEMITATSGISNGIETYPLWDYVLQATFTKMTGFQEQKIKCIDWELATNGYDYRVLFVKEVNGRGTYSTYDSKNGVYNALISEIARYLGIKIRDVIADLRNEIKIEPTEAVKNSLNNTKVIHCRQRDYDEFLNCDKEFSAQFFIMPDPNAKKAKMLGENLEKRYNDEVYRNRNRIAHNTLSYQQNLPELAGLKNENYLSRNYFFWFAVLVSIDQLFMGLYEKYRDCLKNNSYFEE